MTEELSELILQRVGKRGVFLSDIVESLEMSKIKTDNLSETIHIMVAENLIKLTENFIVPPGAKADTSKGASFQILIQKIVTLKDGSRGVEPVNLISTKRKHKIEIVKIEDEALKIIPEEV